MQVYMQKKKCAVFLFFLFKHIHSKLDKIELKKADKNQRNNY